jgi:hypothetical protein
MSGFKISDDSRPRPIIPERKTTAFKATRSSQIIANNFIQKILFANVEFNLNDCASISVGSSDIEVITPGIYQVIVKNRFEQNSSGTRSMTVYRDSTTLSETIVDANSQIQDLNSNFIFENLGSTRLYVEVRQNSGVQLNTDIEFSLILL